METTKTAPRFSIGEADQQSAFLTNPEGWDIATLSRIDVSRMKDPEKSGHSVTDAEWQELVNHVDAAPDMLAALLLARDDLQLISDANDGSHGRTLEAILAAIAKATAPHR